MANVDWSLTYNKKEELKQKYSNISKFAQYVF